MKKYKVIMLVSTILCMVIIVISWMSTDEVQKAVIGQPGFLSWVEFDKLAKQGKVAAVRYSEDGASIAVYEVTDEMNDMDAVKRVSKVPWDKPAYYAMYPGIDELRKTCVRYDIYVASEAKKESMFLILLQVLPMIMLYVMVFKKMGISGDTAEVLVPHAVNVTFADVIGHDEILEDIRFITKFIKDPGCGETVGAKMPKGLLLTGAPGTGKTLIAKAIAGEASIPFLYVDASSFVEQYVGTGAKRVRGAFKKAKRYAPCILFIDEIDAVGVSRVSVKSNQEYAQTLNELLQQMDGFAAGKGVFVIAATNQPDKLDTALTRPGRFDRRIDVNPPADSKVRSMMFEHYFKDMKIDESVDIDSLARQTAGFTGADIAMICNEAGIIAAMHEKGAIDNDCVEEAMDKKLFNGNRSKRQAFEKDREVAAYHEAGHAVVSYLCGEGVSRATIVVQTNGVGGAVIGADSDSLLKTRQDYINKIMICYGGRASEEIKFGQPTAGASNDIRKATELLAEYAGHMGFDEEYGLVNMDVLNGQVIADNKQIVEIIRANSMEMYKTAYRLLEENYSLVEKLAQELLEKESLTGAEISSLFEEGIKVESFY